MRNRTAGVVSSGSSVPKQDQSGKGDIESVGWSPDEKSVIAFGQSQRFVSPNDHGPLERSFDLATLDWSTVPTQEFARAQETQGSQSLFWKDAETVLVKQEGKPDLPLSLKAENQTIFCYTFLPENRIALGTRRYAVYIMDTITGKKISRHYGHDATITSLAPSPDGKYFLTSDGGTIRIWSQKPTHLLLSFRVSGDDWIAWSPAGYYAASLGGEQLMGWEVSNGPNQMQSFYPASRFRKTFCRPDVIKLLLEEGSFEKALARANKERGSVTPTVDVSRVLPPRVAIISPATAKVQVSGTALNVTAVAYSVGANPVTELRVLLDGRPVPDTVKTIGSPVLGAVAQPGRSRWRRGARN